MDQNSYYERRRFDFRLLIGDPFALATLSVSLIGWIIAFASSITSDVSGPYPTFSWWGIAYQLLVIAFVTFVFGANAFENYKIAVVGFTASALIYTTNSTNNLVYTGRAANASAAAGYILLSIINILWIFYFGTSPDASPHAFIDSYALHREREFAASRSKFQAAGGNGPGQPAPAIARGRGPSLQQQQQQQQQQQFQHQQVPHQQAYYTGSSDNGMGGPASIRPPQHMFTSAQLSGFETTSIQASNNRPSIAGGISYANSHNGSGMIGGSGGGVPPPPPLSASGTNLNNSTSNTLMSHGGGGGGGDATMLEPLDAPTEYPLRARAIYSYDANPEDANEISFVKGEILEVSDVSGKWWQARRANGEVGICPSNYVQLET
ncbi:hypothetical protein V1514DRAFT_325617 [Lipomyces japonicus]|uniref:uncharacterized protein n=1 Tax=Lipomyces japonicus TaxID=56871 RepID=UPI0034CD5E78